MNPAFLSEENDAQHDLSVITVGFVADAEVDSKVVPIALDAFQAVAGLEALYLETANRSG
jgi:hypothetical protein